VILADFGWGNPLKFDPTAGPCMYTGAGIYVINMTREYTYSSMSHFDFDPSCIIHEVKILLLQLCDSLE
jgi:hypothetical protein